MQTSLTRTPFAPRALACILAVLAVACGGSSPNAGSGNPPVGSGNPTPPDPGSDGGTPVTNPPPSQAPQITGLSSGALLAGSVALAAAVPDGTARVSFQLDGNTIATSAAAPFQATWDSFSVANGSHALTVQATDVSGGVSASSALPVTISNHINHVFVIVMENHDWSQIKGSSSAPYINGTLLKEGAHADNYQNVPNLHPSLPNYIWLESGSNQGVTDDGQPSSHLLTAPHLTGLLNQAGISWKSYQEDIPGTGCPLTSVNKYFPRHNPAVYFKDINNGLDGRSAVCIQHVRPYAELQADLDADAVPAYNFITPNICNDMHDNSGCQSSNQIANGDGWLAREVPKIMASKAYKDGGAIFITWDESDGSNVPIGMIVLSPLAKAGYAGQVLYTHGSTLRSMQEIFGLTPLLGSAEASNDLSDLFKSFP